MDTYFIGYDAREHEAAGVCAYSILARATKRPKIYMVEHRQLRKLKMFYRTSRIHAGGQMYDDGDSRPFSTDFSHSRFLVFHLARELGITGTCMFVDCDFLFQDDPSLMMREHRKTKKPISVVNRDRRVVENSTKMDGMVQQNYYRKLWSALFCFTPSDKLANLFSVDAVSNDTGRELHGFKGMPQEDFGELNPRWHMIPSLDEMPEQFENIGALHYSEFSPWINPELKSEYVGPYTAWYIERERMLLNAVKTGQIINASNLETDLKLAASG